MTAARQAPAPANVIKPRNMALDAHHSMLGHEKQRIAVTRNVFRTALWKMAQTVLTALERPQDALATSNRQGLAVHVERGGFRFWSQSELQRCLVRSFHPNDIEHSALVSSAFPQAINR